MKNKLFNFKFIAAHKASAHPYLYSRISQLLSGRDCYTNKHTEIVIDGFPRCGNTYATYAFALAQAKKVNIAHHIHKQSQFLIAQKYDIPSILLIRKPVDCITSLLIRQPKYDPAILFEGYYFLYNGLKDLNGYVVGNFENVLNGFDNIIQRVNTKFSCNFGLYVRNDENEAKVKEIIHSQDELIGAKDYKQRVAYPTHERKESNAEIKSILLDKKYHKLNQKCDEVSFFTSEELNAMNKLIIYINTLPVHSKSGGIKTFLLELLYSFAERNNNLFEYVLICSETNAPLFKKLGTSDNFKKLIVKVDNTNPVKRIFFEQFKLNQFLKAGPSKNAILLNICNIALMKCAVPQITIIQAQLSIASLRKMLPKKYVSISMFHKIYYDLLLKRSINISARTVCVSNYMQQFLQSKKEKIVMIHEGVNLSEFRENAKRSSPIHGFSYILSVSTLFPHKNMDKLIMAYSLFTKMSRLPHKLVIAGKDPDNEQLKILQQVAKSQGAEDNVVFLGWVADDDIPALYSNADLFVYISSMEFFGLPVLEAMASGVPVIASNKMSLPEVVNDAALLVEPHNIDEIAASMQALLSSESLRKSLVEKGKANVQRFRWDLTAMKFEKLFLETAANQFPGSFVNCGQNIPIMS